MDAFAAMLRGLSAEYVMYPVVNTTGLEGAWDFDFQWTPRGPLRDGRGGISLFDAMDSQLGIHLEEHTMPLPVLVVNSVNRKPLENSSGGTASLRGSEPIEFEVASVRPN